MRILPCVLKCVGINFNTTDGYEHVEESLYDLEDLNKKLEKFPDRNIRPPSGRIIWPQKADAAKDQAGADGFSIRPPDEENFWAASGDFAPAELRGGG